MSMKLDMSFSYNFHGFFVVVSIKKTKQCQLDIWWRLGDSFFSLLKISKINIFWDSHFYF